MKNSIDFQGFRAAEVARRLGVRRQTFAQRAAKYGAPRLLSGRYDLDATVAWWQRTTRGNGHGGPRRNAGAKPRGLSADALIEGLVDELMAEFQHAPWLGVFREREPGRRHAFTVDEARSALAELPGARDWLMFAWLMGGTWVPLDDDEGIATEEAECRREILREGLWWLVAVYRHALASPGRP
jgi:hypothetical protein